MMSTKIFRSLNIASAGFGLEAEITAKVIKRKLRVIEVSISYIRRSKSQGKKLRLKDGLFACYALIKYTMMSKYNNVINKHILFWGGVTAITYSLLFPITNFILSKTSSK